MPFTHDSFYDAKRSYEENYDDGPFGDFANDDVFQMDGEPQESFLGLPVYAPFGIPAGPLPNAAFVEAAFKKGFDLPVYKTVRTRAHGCHPWPNVLAVHPDGDLTLDKAAGELVADGDYRQPLSITNSFGVPSKDPDEWQVDMRKAVESAGNGQVMIGSFQGTNDGKGVQAFIDDYVLGARLVKETGANILEANLSCPNEGTANLLCFDTDRVVQIADAIKQEIGNTPLLLKLAFFQDDDHLNDYVKRVGKLVDGLVAINTIASSIIDKNGEQALPGEGRVRSGVCGASILWAGLDMVKRLRTFRDSAGLDFKIVGTGGVTEAKDYERYRRAGADAVMSATGAMWNPWLAREVKEGI